VQNARIVEVSNTASNLEVFYIVVEGGSGMCAGGTIRFRLADAGSPGVYERAFAIALAAYLGDEKVSAFDYDTTPDCLGAESLRLVR
jgi:hypothetical protein